MLASDEWRQAEESKAMEVIGGVNERLRLRPPTKDGVLVLSVDMSITLVVDMVEGERELVAAENFRSVVPSVEEDEAMEEAGTREDVCLGGGIVWEEVISMLEWMVVEWEEVVSINSLI